MGALLTGKYQRGLPVLVLFILFIAGCSLLTPEKDASFPRLPSVSATAVPDSITSLLRIDAAILTLRFAANRGDWSITLSEEMQETIYNGLLTIYQARHLATRDSVMIIHHIHASPAPDPYNIIVTYDSSASWDEAWREGDILTGEAELDSLILRYHLTLTVYYNWEPDRGAILTLAEPLNTFALSFCFMDIAKIRQACPLRTVKNTDIHAAYKENYWDFFFCKDSNAGYLLYRFRVWKDGEVSPI